jgi:hypothetical protein
LELSLVGRLYTWSNNRRYPTYEKLDRFLANPEWELKYNDVAVQGLNGSFFDHIPLLLSSDENKAKTRSFRNGLCWRLRPEFIQLVSHKSFKMTLSEKMLLLIEEVKFQVSLIMRGLKSLIMNGT